MQRAPLLLVCGAHVLDQVNSDDANGRGLERPSVGAHEATKQGSDTHGK